MDLFELKNFNVAFSPIALNLKPFKALWSRDKNKNKTRANAELAYVYFMTDYKSDFYDIIDEDERKDEIIKYLTLPDGWKPDSKVLEACDFYRERSETVLTRLLRNIIIGVDNIGRTFREIDVNALDDKGKPLYNLNNLVTAAKGISPLIASLREAELEIKKEKSLDLKNNKGSRSKKTFEDGI